MTGSAAAKAAARAAALRVRAAAQAAHPGAPKAVARHVAAALAGLRSGAAVAGYLPIRSELDPMPALLALAGRGVPLCLPVVTGPAQPLVFRAWTPGEALEAGAFGVMVPVAGAVVVPAVLLVPMLAFDGRGHRLGYGGGFYDRTIAALGPGVRTLGIAYAAQEVAVLPDEGTDRVLDAVVTEDGVRWFGKSSDNND